MNKNNAYLITVTSEREGRKTFSLRVTKSACVAIGVVLFLIVAALGVLLYTAAETARLHRLFGDERERNEKLTKENVLLRQIAGRIGRIDSIASYLELLASPPAAAVKPARQKVQDGATDALQKPGEKAATPVAQAAFDRLPVEGWITQKFTNDTTGAVEHPGIDIAAPEGTPIAVMAPGTVKSVSNDRYYGNLIVITHAAGYETRYGHCKAVFVSAREKVEQGQKIAQVGSTGNSTAPHLHYEILKNGKNINPLDMLQEAGK